MYLNKKYGVSQGAGDQLSKKEKKSFCKSEEKKMKKVDERLSRQFFKRS